MGRRLLVCTPLLSATLVGCLLHPSPRGAARDGGGADGMVLDGSSSAVACPGADTPVDTLATGMCGSQGSPITDGFGTLQARNGTLTASTGQGSGAMCSWSPNAPSFDGVVVRITGAPAMNAAAAAVLSYADSSATYELDFFDGGPVSATNGWAADQNIPFSAPMCARIHLVPAGSGGVMVEGQVYYQGSWQHVASSYSGSFVQQVTLGVMGNASATATFNNLDYVKPGS